MRDRNVDSHLAEPLVREGNVKNRPFAVGVPPRHCLLCVHRAPNAHEPLGQRVANAVMAAVDTTAKLAACSVPAYVCAVSMAAYRVRAARMLAHARAVSGESTPQATTHGRAQINVAERGLVRRALGEEGASFGAGGQ